MFTLKCFVNFNIFLRSFLNICIYFDLINVFDLICTSHIGISIQVCM